MKTYNFNFDDFATTISSNNIKDSNRCLVQIFTSTNSVKKIEKIIQRVKDTLPSAKIIGSTASAQICSENVEKNGTTLSISIFEHTDISTCSVKIKDGNHKELVSSITKKIVTPNTKVIITFADSLHVDGDKYVKALNESTKNIVVSGGFASHKSFEETYIFTQDGVINEGAVALCLNSDELHVNTNYAFNWLKTSKQLVITKSSGNRVYEIDNKNIIDVYRHYLGDYVAKNTPQATLEFPLVFTKNGVDSARTIIGVEDDALIFSGSLKEGTKVYMGFGDVNLMLDTSNEIVGDISTKPIESIFIYSCIARYNFLKKSIKHEIKPFSKIAPTAGFFTFGEIYHSNKSAYLNQSMSILALSETSETSNKNKKIKKQKLKSSKLALSHLMSVTAKELMYQQALFKFSSNLKQQLISSVDMSSTINSSLKCIADFMDVDRAYIFKNKTINAHITTSQLYEYAKPGISPQIDNNELQNLDYLNSELDLWLNSFLNKKSVYGFVKDFPTPISKILKAQNIKSVLCTPIFIDDTLWGFMGLDDCHSERVWDELEISTLQELALSIVVVITKQRLRESVTVLNEKLRKKSILQRKELKDKEKMLIEQSNYAQMGEMINMIAHQWRQPLNAVSAACMKLSLHNELDTITKELTEETIKFIDSQSQKMSNIINDFMNFNKPSDNSELNVKSIIDNVTNMVHAQFTNRSIELSIDIDENINIFHNRKYVEHSLLNILSNSKDAFENSDEIGKIITISTAIHVDNVELIIKDNAGGISKDALKKMYNPYFTTKPSGKGTGIGLYMTKDMLEKIPGTTIVTKSDNGCTTTTITFKRLEDE